jgi:hypothetical protein
MKTPQFTLFVLTSATFGHRSNLTSFKAPPPPDSHHTLSLHTSLAIVIDSILLRYLTPSLLVTVACTFPIPFISKRVRKTEKGFEELRQYILEMISSARDSVATGRGGTITNAALLKNLVEANMKGDGEHKSMTDQELLADVFVCVHVPVFLVYGLSMLRLSFRCSSLQAMVCLLPIKCVPVAQ